MHLYDSMTLMSVEKHVYKQTWRLSHTEQALNIDCVKHPHVVCLDHSLSSPAKIRAEKAVNSDCS